MDNSTIIRRCLKPEPDINYTNTTSYQNFESAAITAQKGVKGAVAGSFGFNLVMAGSLGHLLSMINSLQIIVHLPLLNVAVPANVMKIEELLIPIVMFDIFESEDLLKIVDKIFGSNLLEEDPDKEVTIPQQI